MARAGAGTRLSYRAQQRRFAKSAAFPRWLTVPFTLIIALILWLGVLADPSGRLKAPGAGSVVYVVAVVGVAVFLAYTDRNADPPKKNRSYRPGSRGRRNVAAR
jgi:hypothetical protein